MPSTKLADRRAAVRVPGSYPVQMWDSRHRSIGRGRTANTSESGLLVLLPSGRDLSLAADTSVIIEVELPRSPDHPRMFRKVVYHARIVRVEQMGQWQGVALELGEKIS